MSSWSIIGAGSAGAAGAAAGFGVGAGVGIGTDVGIEAGRGVGIETEVVGGIFDQPTSERVVGFTMEGVGIAGFTAIFSIIGFFIFSSLGSGAYNLSKSDCIGLNMRVLKESNKALLIDRERPVFLLIFSGSSSPWINPQKDRPNKVCYSAKFLFGDIILVRYFL